MNRATTVFLLVILLILLAVIALRPERLSSAGMSQGGYLLRFPSQAIESLEITRGQEVLRFNRGAGGWRMLEPLQDRANAAAIERLIDAAQLLQVWDTLSEKDTHTPSLSELGLLDPSLTLKLSGDKKTWQLDFGREGVAEGLVYARRPPGKKVYLVRDEITRLLRQPVEDFRDPRMLALPAHRIERFRIQRPDGEIELSRERGAWHLLRPLRALAREEEVEQQLEMFLGARVLKFLPHPAPLVTDRTSIKVELWAEGADAPLEMHCQLPAPEDLQNQVQEPAAAVWSASRAALMFISQQNCALLLAQPEEWRDRALVRPVRELVDRISITIGGKISLYMTREGEGGWRTQLSEGAESLPLSDSQAEKLFQILESPVEQFLLPAPGRSLPGEPDVLIELASWLSENTPEAFAGRHPLHEIRIWKNLQNALPPDHQLTGNHATPPAAAQDPTPPNGEPTPAQAEALNHENPITPGAIVDDDPTLRLLSPQFQQRLEAWLQSLGQDGSK